MALTPDDPTAHIVTGPSDATDIASDVQTRENLPARRPSDDLTVPLVVPNQLWTGADPDAYAINPASDITHLREYEASGAGRRDDARWGGMLELIPTKADYVLDLIRANSLWPLLSGLACCAMEMISIVGGRMDIARFGAEAMRGSPRQADLLIISGRISIKMAPIVRRVYDQMLEPKWAIAMGACSSSMGVFNNYALVPADKFLPVDVHVPGCPPRPESLMHGILKLRKMIQEDPDMGWRAGHQAYGTEEILPGEGQETAVNVFRPGNTAGA